MQAYLFETMEKANKLAQQQQSKLPLFGKEASPMSFNCQIEETQAVLKQLSKLVMNKPLQTQSAVALSEIRPESELHEQLQLLFENSIKVEDQLQYKLKTSFFAKSLNLDSLKQTVES